MIDEDDQAMHDKRIAGLDYLKRESREFRHADLKRKSYEREARLLELVGDIERFTKLDREWQESLLAVVEKNAEIKQLQEENRVLKERLAIGWRPGSK